MDLRSEEDRAARAVRAGDTVRYWSGRGHAYEAKVVSVPKEGQNHSYPPTLELEFRDERGKLQRRARSLHMSAGYGKRLCWETIGALIGTELGAVLG